MLQLESIKHKIYIQNEIVFSILHGLNPHLQDSKKKTLPKNVLDKTFQESNLKQGPSRPTGLMDEEKIEAHLLEYSIDV